MKPTHLRCAGILAAVPLSGPLRHHVHGIRGVSTSLPTDDAAAQQEIITAGRRSSSDCKAGSYSVPAGSSVTVSGALCSPQLNRNYRTRNVLVNGYPSYKDASNIYDIFVFSYLNMWLLAPFTSIGSDSPGAYVEGYCPTDDKCNLASIFIWFNHCPDYDPYEDDWPLAPDWRVLFSNAGAAAGLSRLPSPRPRALSKVFYSCKVFVCVDDGLLRSLAVPCTSCLPGTYSSAAGEPVTSSGCADPPPYMTRTLTATGASACQQCQAGTYSGTTGQRGGTDAAPVYFFSRI